MSLIVNHLIFIVGMSQIGQPYLTSGVAKIFWRIDKASEMPGEAVRVPVWKPLFAAELNKFKLLAKIISEICAQSINDLIFRFPPTAG